MAGTYQATGVGAQAYARQLAAEARWFTLVQHGLEVGPAYVVWTGIGAVGTAVVGMAALGESVSALKLVSIGLVLAGVVGLNLSGVTP